MKKSLAIFTLLSLTAGGMQAADTYHLPPYTTMAMRPLTYHVDSMPTSLRSKKFELKDNNAKKFDIKPYRFKDDMTYVGLPIFAAGIIAKSEKASFRQDYNNTHARGRLLTNFHNEIDNYTQYVPFALAAGLNFAGVEGRSDHLRFLTSSAMAYGIMAAIVNPIKYSAKEMRPDGSTRNSWPSGHTATAFASATILHKEYGLTRSPWYSVAGYGIATATGVMRVLNNRHWVSDVLSGAGIGIVSTELAYGLSDLIFKGKHLKRNDLLTTADIIEHPSFFSISMGVGLGSKDLEFSGKDLEYSDDQNINLKFSTATVVGAEGAYFFNRYFGIGGRLRVKSSPIKGWNDVASKESEQIENTLKEMGNNMAVLNDWFKSNEITIESDHITEFSADLGAYFNLPLSNRFALGTKLLVGRSIMQDLDINAHFSGNVMGFTDTNFGPIKDANGQYQTFDTDYDYLTVSANNTMKYGTGLSLTYAYKSNFSWKIFADYDFSRKHYTMEYDPYTFLKTGSPDLYGFLEALMKSYDYGDNPMGKKTSTIKKNMHSIVLGASFTVSF